MEAIGHRAGFGSRLATLALAVSLAVMTGCPCWEVPDQTPYKSLEELGFEDDAIVRLYGAPLPFVQCFGYHSWVVMKPKGSAVFDRWEVGISWKDPYGHLWKNGYEAYDYDANPGQFVLSEVTGEAAEAIINFVETQSPNYPLQERFTLLPGPNCNTYTNWVVTNSGWDYTCPDQMIGKDFPVNWPPAD
ncbi:MAG: DUF3750 domain-containing protein [Phycisphaerae bacterium]|nr:DUF3750 domain-containing protein [Phycisphaerae bacterium]